MEILKKWFKTSFKVQYYDKECLLFAIIFVHCLIWSPPRTPHYVEVRVVFLPHVCIPLIYNS